MRGAGTLVFDLDGTLTDNFAGIAASICHALARLDHPAPDPVTLRTCVGPPLRETFARLLATDDRDPIERAVAHYRERYDAIGWRENAVYDGIPEALRILGGHARLLLCSVKPEPFARRIVAHYGLDRYLAGVYAADLHGAFDDKARLIERLLSVEGVSARDAVMIGDRHNDIRAARANHVRAIGVLWGYGAPEELSEADALVETPGALVELLRPAGG
jgi:phosphoglycolate phosphatase